MNVIPELRAQLVTAVAAPPRRRPAAGSVASWAAAATGCAVLAMLVIRLLGAASVPAPELPAAAPPQSSPAPLFPSEPAPAEPYPLSLATGAGNTLCLIASRPTGGQLRRCDPGPAPQRPFGPVMRIVDEHGRRLLYGLVADGVDRVLVAGVATPVVPARSSYGRIFFTPLHTSYIDLAALDAGGGTIGTLGGRPGARPPLSYDEARATGDPAAFAPTAVHSAPAAPAVPTAPLSALNRLKEPSP